MDDFATPLRIPRSLILYLIVFLNIDLTGIVAMATLLLFVLETVDV